MTGMHKDIDERSANMTMYLSNPVHKEVSRKQFVGLVGLAVLSIFGFGALLKLLTAKSLETHQPLSDEGGSVYGSATSNRSRL
jgi:hypothetical protein